MAIDRPETNAGAPPFAGAGQHRKNFLVPRGMAANPGSPCGLPHGVGPSGEESCDDAVALKRSKRPALVFGQIRPLKRPFRAVETRGLNGDVAILRPIMMTRRVTPALLVALRLRPCASLFPACAPPASPQPSSGQSRNAGADRSALLWAASVPQADPMLGRCLPPLS